jgi:competence/damage-inducible protein CinA-like protein
MKPCVEIFSQGEEIITGQIVDSNSAWLANQLNDLGFRVIRHSVVGDDLTHLKQLLLEIAGRADCCVCSGGLGPTVDDLTAQAVADAFGLSLKMDDVALQQIQAYFAQRQRNMADSNRKQALLPKGCIRLDNHWGTAPGFALKFKQCWFYFMPGVPAEMKQMFAHGVRPRLIVQFPLQADQQVILRTVGTGESDIQQKLQPWHCPDGVRLGFRTTGDDIEVKLAFPAGFSDSLRQQIIASLSDCLGDCVYRVETTNNSQTLTEVVAAKLLQQQLHLCLIETVSYGAIAARFAGSSVRVSAQVRADLSEQAGQCSSTDLKNLAARHPPAHNELLLLQSYESNQHKLLTFLATKNQQLIDDKTVMGSARQIQHRATVVALDLIRKFL